MRIPRIYQPSTLKLGETCNIDGQAAHHLLKVLRCRIDQRVTLFNGDGFDYSSRITTLGKNRLGVLLEEISEAEAELPLKIHLGIPLSKGQRMDYAIQKAVELGVNEITPLMTSRSVVKLDQKRQEGKLQHWQQVVISACEQCGRSRIPNLHPLENLDIWSRDATFGIVLDPYNATSIRELRQPQNMVHLIAGPEGGFTRLEVESLVECGFHAVTLGPRILRTETAPLAAISALQLLWGDF
jgi:16S rRNA (uracil1498-N3)-methyltransferase